MPRVKPLTVKMEQKELNRRGDQLMSDIIVLYKARNRKTDDELGAVLGAHGQKIRRVRAAPGNARLDDIRVLAHAMSMKQEDWLRIGGFKV